MAEVFEDNFFEIEKKPEWHDKVHGWTVDSKVEGGVGGVDNLPLEELAGRTEFLKEEVEVIKGLSPGGYLDANDFGSKTPDQQALTDYALLKIGGTDPLKIWNGTRVKNLFDNSVWILTNTPDTVPPIFEWSNDGPEIIAIDGTVFGGDSAPFLASSDKRKLVIKAGTKIKLGSRTFRAEEDTELDIASLLDTGALVNGKDYYVFLCPDTADTSSTLIRVSLVKTNPVDMFPEDVLLIGGFHTLCADAGTGMTYVEGGETKDHPLNGYVAGDILPASVWCLNHRPHSEPEGMVYIPSLDFWVDIYLQSGSGKNTKSVYQGALTRSRQYVDHVEDMFCVKKELLDDGEFAVAMLGSNETTSVAGSSESGATSGGAGGRKDTAGRRMISVYGVEEGCGSLWQWLRTTSAAGVAGSIYGQTDASGTQGWINMTTGSYGPYPQSGGKGSFWGIAGALRARNAPNSRSHSDSTRGGRGRSRTRR